MCVILIIYYVTKYSQILLLKTVICFATDLQFVQISMERLISSISVMSFSTVTGGCISKMLNTRLESCAYLSVGRTVMGIGFSLFPVHMASSLLPLLSQHIGSKSEFYMELYISGSCQSHTFENWHVTTSTLFLLVK